jgi:hypothetical protein
MATPIPLLPLIGSIAGGLLGGWGEMQGMKEIARSNRYAADITRQNFQDTRDLLMPSVSAGDTARGYTLGALGLPGGVSYDEALRAFRTSPGYDFRLGQGQNAVMSSAAAGGNLYSGKTLRDLARFGQGLAGEEFGNWMGGLSGLAGGGMRATGALVDAGMGTSRTLADLALGGGQARASSYGGIANAGIGTLQNLANLHAYYNPPQWAAAGSPARNLNYTWGGLN